MTTEPPAAEKELKRKDTQSYQQTERGARIAIQPQTETIKQSHTDNGLKNIVREAHPAIGNEQTLKLETLSSIVSNQSEQADKHHHKQEVTDRRKSDVERHGQPWATLHPCRIGTPHNVERYKQHGSP